MSAIPARVQLWAEIGEERIQADLVTVSLMYGMNEIPSGVLGFPLGRGAYGQQLAAIHRLGGSMEVGTPIRVYCRLTAKREHASRIPRGTFLLLEGQMAGNIGFDRDASGNAVFSVGVMNFLEDLHYSSCVSPQLMPDAPDTFFKSFNTQVTNVNGRAQLVSSVYGMQAFVDFFAQDMWDGLKKIFTRFAEGESLYQLIGLAEKNDIALAVLEKFNNEKITHVTLKIRDDFLKVAGSLSSQIASTIFDARSHSSMWNKLLGAASFADFAVIPSVEGVTLAPHVYQNSNIFQTVKASDVFSEGIRPFMRRQLAGLILMAATPSTTNTLRDSKDLLLRNIVGASSGNLLTGKIKGMILFKMLPDWMVPHGDAVLSTGDAGAKKMSNSVRLAPKGQKTKDTKLMDFVNAVSGGLGQELAKSYFFDEQFKNRLGVIQGRVRFDIGPGSSIAVEGVGADVLGYAEDLFANVVRVGLDFDASRPLAATTLHLSNIRTKKDAKSALESHPLYTEKWFGTPLMPNPHEGTDPNDSED